MTTGDVVALVANVAGWGSLVFQPAAGVEVMISNVGAYGNTWFGLTNGVGVTAIIYLRSAANLNTLSKIFVNNTTYLSIQNDQAGATNLGYCGIQIK